MRNGHTRMIDWDATREYAERLTPYELRCAILDCQRTLPMADAMDRDHMQRCAPHCVTCYHQSEGGYYRDCISVYRKVLTERGYQP